MNAVWLATTPRAVAILFSGVFGLAGLLWIFYSDRLLASLVADAETLTRYQTYKGWGYVLLSTMLVYGLIRVAQVRHARFEHETAVHRQLALDAGSLGTWRCDAAKGVVRFDARARAHFGAAEGETGVAALAGRVHPADRQRFEVFADALCAGRDGDAGSSIECRVVRAQGDVRWIAVAGRTLFEGEDGERRPVGCVGTSQDVTARKAAERELRQWADAFRYCAHGIVMGDPRAGTVIACNPAFAKLHGDTENGIVGRPIVELYAPGERAQVLERILVADRSGEVRYEARMMRRDGSTFPAQMDVVSVRDETGSVLYRVATQQDITGRQRAEAEIRELNASLERRVSERTAELEAANRELDSFAYAVSHDLRAPLRALNGFSRALIEDHGPRLDGEARAYLEQIIKGSRTMGDLIDGLLTLSRSTRGELVREPVDLSAIATRILDELAGLEPQRRVERFVEPGLVGRGDARMLEAVLRNLLGNAWKYTAKTAASSIRFHGECREEGLAGFCVSDNGAGFDPAHADRMFRPFQRLHRQDEFPGIGIGLATVQRIIHRHGGTIEAAGATGVGAKFCFTLPAVAKEGSES